MEDYRNIKPYFLIFSGGLIIDTAIIIWAAINSYILIMITFGVIAILGSMYLLNKWNIDERTDKVLTEASKDVSNWFIRLTSIISIILLIYSYYNNFIFWEVGTTLLVWTIMLFYFQAIVSVFYEYRMS